MTSTEIVPAANIAALDTFDPQAREVAITGYLVDARERLDLALRETGPETVANFRAEMATVAEMSKRLGVSKEIQEDAVEMVRRSEFALGKSIRAGQERGEVETLTDARSRAGAIGRGNHRDENTVMKTPLSEIAGRDELMGNRAGIYHLTDGVTEEEFDEALDRAKDEHNLSRANVVRKVQDVKSGAEVQQAKWARVAEMAERGYTSPQIAREVGMSEGGLKHGAKREGIDIRADRIVGNVRRLDMRRVVSQTVADLEAIAVTSGSLITTDGLLAARIDPEEIQTWVDSLNQSLTGLRKATNQIAKAGNQIKESIS